MAAESALKRLGLLHLRNNPRKLNRAIDEILASGAAYVRGVRLRRQVQTQKRLKQN